MLCNIAGGTLAAILADIYHVELNWQNAVLAIFIPVVLALAESVAIQSVTLTLDGIRGAKPTWGELFRRCPARTAHWTCCWGSRPGCWWPRWPRSGRSIPVLFLIVLGGIGIGVTGGAVCGLAVPYLLHLMSRDPQVAAGPIALASADVIVLLAYFNLALLLT